MRISDWSSDVCSSDLVAQFTVGDVEARIELCRWGACRCLLDAQGAAVDRQPGAEIEPLAGDRGNEGDIASRLLPAALQVGGNKIPEALAGDRTGEARRALQADAGERLQASELFHLYRRGEPGGAVGQVEGTAGGDSRRAGVSLQVVEDRKSTRLNSSH